MAIRTYSGFPWPYQSTAIGLDSNIKTEFGGNREVKLSNYYRGGPIIGNTGAWAGMSDTRVNGKITTIPQTEIAFSDFIGSSRYRSGINSYEGSVMQLYGTGVIRNQFAPITWRGAQHPGQHCGSFRPYSAFHPNFPNQGRLNILAVARFLGWPRYVRVGLDNTVSVRTRGDEQERKGSNRYTHVRNAGFQLWFAASWGTYWTWGNNRYKVAQRDNFKVGAWTNALKITAYASSVNDDRWGSGSLTDTSGTGGTFGGGGGGGGIYGGGGSGFTTGSGTRVPSNVNTYYDLKALYDSGHRWLYFMHTMEVNLASCNTNPNHNYMYCTGANIRITT